MSREARETVMGQRRERSLAKCSNSLAQRENYFEQLRPGATHMKKGILHKRQVPDLGEKG